MIFVCLGSLVVQWQGIAIGGVPSTNIAGVVMAENEAQADRNPTTRLILGIPQTATFSKYILVHINAALRRCACWKRSSTTRSLSRRALCRSSSASPQSMGTGRSSATGTPCTKGSCPTRCSLATVTIGPRQCSVHFHVEVSEPESTDDTDSTDPAEPENIERACGCLWWSCCAL